MTSSHPHVTYAVSTTVSNIYSSKRTSTVQYSLSTCTHKTHPLPKPRFTSVTPCQKENSLSCYVPSQAKSLVTSSLPCTFVLLSYIHIGFASPRRERVAPRFSRAPQYCRYCRFFFSSCSSSHALTSVWRGSGDFCDGRR